MAIRQVDMQVMMHRAAEINRATNNDGSRAENQNTQFAQQFAKAVEQDGRQVVNSNEVERPDVDKDGGRAKDEREGKKKRRQREEDEKKKGMQSRSMLDIKI